MADDPQTPENEEEELLLTEEVEQQDPPAAEGEEDDEIEVPTFGDTPEEAHDTDTTTIRHMRQVAADALKRAAAAERERDELRARGGAPQQSAPVDPGPKPTLADCDFDEDEYDKRKAAWDEKVRAAQSFKSTEQESAETQRKQWDERLERIGQQKTTLGPKADDAFIAVRDALGENKFLSILAIADEENAAKLIYALAESPAKLTALASQNDSIRLVKEITKLEGQLKMVKRKGPIDPDTPERGSAKVSNERGDKKLAKLEEEANRTGDRSKLIQYKKELKRAAAR